MYLSKSKMLMLISEFVKKIYTCIYITLYLINKSIFKYSSDHFVYLAAKSK